NSATTGHLPQARNSGLYFEYATAMPNTIGAEFVRYGWTRTNQRHISAQNVPELRYFVETGLAQQLSYASDARIFFDFENSLFWPFGAGCYLAGDKLVDKFLVDFFIAIGPHRAEFK